MFSWSIRFTMSSSDMLSCSIQFTMSSSDMFSWSIQFTMSSSDIFSWSIRFTMNSSDIFSCSIHYALFPVLLYLVGLFTSLQFPFSPLIRPHPASKYNGAHQVRMASWGLGDSVTSSNGQFFDEGKVCRTKLLFQIKIIISNLVLTIFPIHFATHFMNKSVSFVKLSGWHQTYFAEPVV